MSFFFSRQCTAKIHSWFDLLVSLPLRHGRPRGFCLPPKLSPTRGLCLCLRCATSRLSAAQWLSAIRSLQRLPSRLWSSTSRLCPAAQLWLCPSPCGLCPTGRCLWRGLWGTAQLWCTAAQLWRAATGLWGATGLWSSIWLWSHLFFSTRVRSVRTSDGKLGD